MVRGAPWPRPTPAVATFLVVALACQVIVISRLAGIAAGIVYPFGSALLLIAVVALVRRFATETEVDRPDRPRLELALAVLAVALHVTTLLPQLPALRNPLSLVLLRLVPHGSPQWLGALIFGVVVPCLFLAPVRPRLRAFGFAGFPWRLWLGLTLVYAPLLLVSGARPTLAGAATYLVGAALPEELLYRAVLQSRLEAFVRERMHAVLIASLIFGFMHLPINVAHHGWQIGVLFCVGQNAFGGLIAGHIYERTRSLPLVVLHHAWSGIVVGSEAG